MRHETSLHATVPAPSIANAMPLRTIHITCGHTNTCNPDHILGRYYASEWRRADPGMQIKETSVHFTAALRLLASAAGLGEAVQVTAVSQHAKPDLTNPDTLCGTVLFAGPASSSNSTPAPEASAEGQAGDESSGASPVPASVSISLAAAQVGKVWAKRF